MPGDRDEWGPWQRHDGHGFPVPVGTVVHRVLDGVVDLIDGVECEARTELVCPLEARELASWLWCLPRDYPMGQVPHVIFYRVRKPRGMEILEDLVANAPASEDV